MEHAIGEIVTLPDGRKAEVVKCGYGCMGCYYDSSSICIDLRRTGKLGICCMRTDHKNIIYKEIKEE